MNVDATTVSKTVIPTSKVNSFPDLPAKQPGPPFEFGPLESWKNTVVGSMQTIANGQKETTWLALGNESFNPHAGFDSLEDAEFAASQLTIGDKPAVAVIGMWGKFYAQSIDTVTTEMAHTRSPNPKPPTTFLRPLHLEGKTPGEVGVFTFGIPGVQSVIDGEQQIWKHDIEKA